jgi:hypothetical protein
VQRAWGGGQRAWGKEQSVNSVGNHFDRANCFLPVRTAIRFFSANPMPFALCSLPSLRGVMTAICLLPTAYLIL